MYEISLEVVVDDADDDGVLGLFTADVPGNKGREAFKCQCC